MTDRVWIVSPVYRDVDAFLMLRAEIRAELDGWSGLSLDDIQFVVLDDTAGVDREVDQLHQLEDVTVLVPPFSLGHQRGLVYALRRSLSTMADEDTIVTMDADGEDKPSDLRRMLSPLEDRSESPEQVVLARRTKRRESLAFKILYAMFRLAFRILAGTSVKTGNYAAYRAGSVRSLLQHPYFNLCYSTTFSSLAVPTVYVPCARGERYSGASRMTYPKLILHGLSMLMPFTDRIAVRALVAFSVTMGVSIVTAVVVVCVKLFSNEAIPGWATYTLLLLITLSFVALGSAVVLLAVFAQSRGSALANIEQFDERPRVASPTAD
jgi:polyisoprenyl-phosphate glycosyltransferase